MAVKLNTNQRAQPSYGTPVGRPADPTGTPNTGYGKGKTEGTVPANLIPSLGVVGVASGSKPAEVSASKKAVKAITRQPDDVCDPDDPDYDPTDCDDRKRRK